MESVINEIKCMECNGILQSAILLPCSKSICSNHVTKQDTAYYRCPFCQQDHPQDGFLPNKASRLLIDLYLPEYKEAFDSCEFLKGTIDRFERLKNEPESFIDDRLNDLKETIKLKRDELIQDITDRCDTVLIEIDVFAKQCAAALNDLEDRLGIINKKVERTKIELSRLKSELSELKTPNILGDLGNNKDALSEFKAMNQPTWNLVLVDSKQLASELGEVIEMVKGMLFLDKFEEYQKKKEKFCNLDFRRQEFVEHEMKTEAKSGDEEVEKTKAVTASKKRKGRPSKLKLKYPNGFPIKNEERVLRNAKKRKI